MPEHLEPGHELIVGATRSGKSFLTLYRIMRSFRSERPLCFIDPRGDGYRHLLSWFACHPVGQQTLAAYSDRIVLVNPVSPAPYRVGFNAIGPLEAFDEAKPDLISLLASGLVSHLRRQYGADWGETNRYEGILTAAIGALVEGGEGMYTLAEIPQLLTPSTDSDGKSTGFYPFLNLLLRKVTHPGTRIFFDNEWRTMNPHSKREWVEPVNSRVLKYLFDQRLLTTLCTTSAKGTLDFRRVLRDGLWLFVNLPYQYLSEFGTTLIGNLIVSRLQNAGLQEPPRQFPYRIILDEGRFFATGPVDVITETTGKYNLWLSLLVQSLEQLTRGAESIGLYKTLLNNSRYVFAFNSEADDEALADLLFPVTGRVEMGRRKSGNFLYDAASYNPIFLPVEAERDANRRKLSGLAPRQFYFFDRFSRDGARLLTGPWVDLPTQVDSIKLAKLEADHLRRTGQPVADIEDEIRYRRLAVDRIIAQDFGAGPVKRPARGPKQSGRSPAPDFGEER